MEEITNSISELLESSFIEIYIIDVETSDIVYANEAALKNLGYSYDELIGMSAHDIATQKYTKEELKSYFVSQDHDENHIPEVMLNNYHQRKDKSVYFVEVHVQLTSYKNKPAYTAFVMESSEKRSESDQLNSLIESISIGYWDMDYTTSTSKVSDGWLEMLGFSRDDIKTDAIEFFSRIHPDDYDYTQEKIARYKEKGVPFSMEFRMMHKDGHWLWIQSSGSVVATDPVTNEPLRRCGIHMDITERKQGEVRREQFYNFFQISQDIMLIADDQANFVEVNPATLKVLGYAEEELLSRPIADLLHPDDVNATEEGVGGIKHDGVYVNFENRWRCKDGSYRWFSWRIAYDEKHKLAYCIARDITDQKKAAVEQKKQENMYRSLAEYSKDVIVKYDRKHRHIYVNPAISQFLDFTEADLLGKTHKEMGYPEDLCELWGESIEQVFVTGEPQYEFFEADGKNGHMQIDWRVFPEFGPDGSVESVFSVSRDISEFKKLEEEQQKTQQLSSLGVLAGGIAHDFNNILTALFGNISLAKSQIPEGNASLLTLEKAEKAFHRASHLTNQLLTFAKGGDPVKQDVSISSLVKEISQFDLSGSNVKLVFNPAEDLWKAQVDRGQMAQVFSNLTINADQAMPEGGHLYITVENAIIQKGEVRTLEPGRYLKFTVEDEGIGIGERDLKRIFDPYYSTKHTGSGLGLATVYSIMNKHGGYICVSSNKGKGACFTLYLPASESKEGLGQEKLVERPARIDHSATVLVMDDEEMIRSLAIAMLEREEYIVEGVEDGLQAIEAYKQAMEKGQKFDCVIMDLTIPGGMGGAEAVKEILKLDPEARVVVSSGYAVDPIMANYKDYGFKGVIAKPFTMNTLQEEMRRILGEQ